VKLKVILKGGKKGLPGRTSYVTEVNAENFKEIALVFLDLESRGVPLKKAIKEFKLGKSDWEMALGL
jgi:hypothetical protein